MKLLLTSAGLKNKTLINEFLRLVGKPAKEVKVAFIPTAANVEKGNKDWLIDNLWEFKNLVGEVDIVDIAVLSKKQFMPRLEWADVIVFGGGLFSYLYDQVVKSGLNKELPRLLKKRLYFGINAGSMILGPKISGKLSQKYFKERLKGTLGYVKFWIKPHYNSPYFTDRNKKELTKLFKDTPEKVYALDDNSGVSVSGNRIKITSEGEWLEFKNE